MFTALKLLLIDYLHDYLRLHVKYFLRGLPYNKEVAALQKSLSSCPTSVPWDVEIRPCTSGSSNECQQRASRSTELQFPPSITSVSRSIFANSHIIVKSFSSVVSLVRLPANLVWQAEKPLDAVKCPLVTISSEAAQAIEVDVGKKTFLITRPGLSKKASFRFSSAHH